MYTINKLLEFHNVAKCALNALVEHIFRDVKEVMEKFFQKEWYEGKLMEQVIATLADYFGDIEGHIMESYYRKLV